MDEMLLCADVDARAEAVGAVARSDKADADALLVPLLGTCLNRDAAALIVDDDIIDSIFRPTFVPRSQLCSGRSSYCY